MKVLVCVASRHGASRQIAARIAARLGAGADGLDVEVAQAQQVRTVARYGAVILGSAVYEGRWMPAARELVARHATAMRDLPVWLFSSGPVDDRPTPEPTDAAPAVTLTGAREQRVFGGRMERDRLSWPGQALVAMMRVPDADRRDWAAIDAWADGIGAALRVSH